MWKKKDRIQEKALKKELQSIKRLPIQERALIKKEEKMQRIIERTKKWNNEIQNSNCEQQMQNKGKEDVDKTLIEKKDKTQRIMQEIEKTKLDNKNLIV